MANIFFNILNEDPLDYNIYIKIKNLFLSLGLTYICIIFSVAIILGIDYFIVDFLHYESVRELFSKSTKVVNKRNAYYVAIIGPFTEEILFRLALKFNRFNISVFIILFCYAILGGKIETFNFTDILSYFKVLLSILSGFLCYNLINNNHIEKLNKYRKYIIWFSIFTFGLAHLININKVGQMYWQLALFYPFFVLPYLSMGYFMANIRLKQGFIWGFLLHFIINSIATLLSHL
jgi:hypothetical protein